MTPRNAEQAFAGIVSVGASGCAICAARAGLEGLAAILLLVALGYAIILLLLLSPE